VVSNQEKKMQYQMEWVKLARYIELSGDTADAVHGRRRLGKWLDGVHTRVVDGKLWVCLAAVEAWIKGDKPHDKR
jgi:hypothetical protein